MQFWFDFVFTPMRNGIILLKQDVDDYKDSCADFEHKKQADQTMRLFDIFVFIEISFDKAVSSKTQLQWFSTFTHQNAQTLQRCSIHLVPC
jgi:hypothetical protein